jgi:hypothetical protein
MRGPEKIGLSGTRERKDCGGAYAPRRSLKYLIFPEPAAKAAWDYRA